MLSGAKYSFTSDIYFEARELKLLALLHLCIFLLLFLFLNNFSPIRVILGVFA